MRPIDADEYKKKLYAMMPEFDEENDKKCIEGQTIFFCIAVLNDMPTIAPPPNDPLTLDELQEMDGDIVYCTPLNDWAKVTKIGLLFFGTSDNIRWIDIITNYGKTWLAYRRKKEGA